MSKHAHIFGFLFALLFLSSCVSHRQLLHFRTDEDQPLPEKMPVLQEPRNEIQPGDLLSIGVFARNSLDMALTAPFMLGGTLGSNGTPAPTPSSGNSGNHGPEYLVDSQGNIDFPVLGKVHLAGYTVEEARDRMVHLLQAYIKDPIVILRHLNFRVTILGEVGSPGTVSAPNGRVNLLEALGQVGDLTPYARRRDIIVIREIDGVRHFGHIDLQSPDVFNSPYFYLRQNDIVYVEPSKAKVATVADPVSKTLPWIATLTSVTSIIFSILR